MKPAGHGMIVRTAAEGVSAEELQRDVTTLVEQWNAIEAEAKKSNAARASSTASPTWRCGSCARS